MTPPHATFLQRGAALFLGLGLALSLVCPQASAQVAPAAHAAEGPSFVPMSLALLFVLALLGAAVWVLRRTGIAPRQGSSNLRLVGQLALGPRERVVVVQAGERWLVLGVSAAGISRLANLPPQAATPVAPATAAPAQSFETLFRRLRGGGA